jgi:hypothetical protein
MTKYAAGSRAETINVQRATFNVEQTGGSSSPLLDANNGGAAAYLIASPDGAANPPRFIV